MKNCKTCREGRSLVSLRGYLPVRSPFMYCPKRDELNETPHLCESWLPQDPEKPVSRQRLRQAEEDVREILCIVKTNPEIRRRKMF